MPPLNTVALELVPPNTDRTPDEMLEEARKVVQLSAETGVRIGHVMIPGMIEEDSGRPIEMKPKLDVLDYWSRISPELPGVRGLCTQVTAFMDEPTLVSRLTALLDAGMEGVAFVGGVPRTMNDGEGAGVAPTDALTIFLRARPEPGGRDPDSDPCRGSRPVRFQMRPGGATYGMTQLLYSDAIVGFLTEFAATTDYRPEILLSFGFVPKVESRVGLINWLIQDPGNAAVAAEQDFVRTLAESEPPVKRQLLVDLYKRVIDGVVDLGFPPEHPLRGDLRNVATGLRHLRGDAGLLVAGRLLSAAHEGNDRLRRRAGLRDSGPRGLSRLPRLRGNARRGGPQGWGASSARLATAVIWWPPAG